MTDSKKRVIHSKSAGFLTVLLLSILSFEIVFMGSRFLETWEPVFTDMCMRWRSTLSYSSVRKHTDNITLLAIDARTQIALGRFGAGMWLSRKPFVDSLVFFSENFSPTVLGYDIILVDSIGARSLSEDQRISENREKLLDISKELVSCSEKTADNLTSKSLTDMNQLVSEQGNKTYSSKLASIQEDDAFSCLLGMNLRGGSIDIQPVKIDLWSDEDVFGSDPDGDEDAGVRIPYLKDMAIPDANIHFPSQQAQTDYICSPNGNLPTTEFLDYSYIAPINGPRDADGVLRRLPMLLGVKYYNSITRQAREFFIPSFSLAAALLHLGIEFPLKDGDVDVRFGDKITINTGDGREIRIPIDESGKLYLNYDNTFSDFDAISFVDVAPSAIGTTVEGRKKRADRWKKYIDDRVILIGVTATGMDVGATPLYSNIPLVFTQMTAINNILTSNFLRPIRPVEKTLLWGILFILFTSLCHFQKTYKLGPVAFMFASMYFLTAYVSIHRSIVILPVLQPILYITLCYFAVLSYRFFTEERAKRKIRGMFSTMVSDKVLAYLEENPQSFSLQGRNVEASVFFSDVARFTSMSEKLNPEKLTKLLNSYLTPITDNIMKWDGNVDKYVGDGIMAVWGAPNLDPEHAVKACASALEQQRLVDDMNPMLKRDFGVEFQVRMGINSGVVTAGNMGSEKKFQYTVMGDVVNLASRLEPVNKEFDTKIIIGKNTVLAIRDKYETRMLERIVVQGRIEVEPIYELLGRKGSLDERILEVRDLYEEAIKEFHSKNWSKALHLTEDILKIMPDGPARRLKEWSLRYKDNPPGSEWQGEYIRDTKH